jgi:corrinoid protein of di/trimethylamine methyltransferase
MNDETILEDLYEAVLNGDVDGAKEAARQSLEAGMSPLKAVHEGLTPGIREVGDRFGRMEAFLPEMVLAADAMQGALTVLRPHFGEGGGPRKGKVLIGTVKGDIHDIGKNIAIALLKVNGYEVVDLGRDVDSVAFVDKAEEEDARIIGLSGLLTTSLPMMREVIALLEEAGIRDRYHVILGGGPTNQEFADSIGASGYAATAHDGVQLCDRLIGQDQD